MKFSVCLLAGDVIEMIGEGEVQKHVVNAIPLCGVGVFSVGEVGEGVVGMGVISVSWLDVH